MFNEGCDLDIAILVVFLGFSTHLGASQVAVSLAWLSVSLQGCGGGSSNIETTCSETLARGQCSKCMCSLERSDSDGDGWDESDRIRMV